MTKNSYNHCPIAVASALLEPRWTMLVLFELWSGNTRFNQFRRGLPNMSPGLLSKRLKEMELNGLVLRQENVATGGVKYSLTETARSLEPIVDALGRWAHRNIDTAPSLECPDVKLLMWNIMREVDPACMPKSKRITILFHFPKLPDFRARQWLICPPNSTVELCAIDPGFDLDAIVTADLTSLTSVWLGCSSLEAEIDSGHIDMAGDPRVEVGIRKWFAGN
ncbi:MAG: helix-turn-helix transcriptional regulator [Rhodobacteraceae bacterium]|nr:helix-turn-helix transcriptional regulator [Paracoccaceae bacterium]